MLKKLTCRLLLVASLFVLSAGQLVYAVDKSAEALISSVELSEKININSANAEQLSVVNGIGNKKAQAIVDYRENNGNFLNIDELINVKGIGQSTLKKITPFVTL
ncbi:ComEA family DNA-binding protein [Psychromonas ossibalaenae]|uniref:ComEA family DNA-binding protein n=1 Tax=Psychromonas ossibalaenae TaxID=444922 RepID=UPI00036BFF9A|nr:ComEA family DNA-binding protein [Psychromonas ossibalaenae]